MGYVTVHAMRNRIDRSLSVLEIYPGGFYISTTPCIIGTTLGSCIAVCFYAKDKGIGTMSHCILPAGVPDSPKDRYRFVDAATNNILELLYKKGVEKTEILAMVFGGARKFIRDENSIGIKNVAMAKTILKKNNIPIVAESTGGTIGRKVYFNTASGEVYMRKIHSEHITQFNYAEKMNQKATSH